MLNILMCEVTSISDSLRPSRLSLARLLCPRDSPGKNSGMCCHALPPRDLPNPGIKPVSLISPALVDGFFTTSATWEAQMFFLQFKNNLLEIKMG